KHKEHRRYDGGIGSLTYPFCSFGRIISDIGACKTNREAKDHCPYYHSKYILGSNSFEYLCEKCQNTYIIFCLYTEVSSQQPYSGHIKAQYGNHGCGGNNTCGN